MVESTLSIVKIIQFHVTKPLYDSEFGVYFTYCSVLTITSVVTYNSIAFEISQEGFMNLEKIRNRISEIDFEIIQLLNERMENSLRTSRYKDKIYDPEREEAILEKILQIESPLLNKDFINILYKEIFNLSRSLQKERRKLVGFQGVKGANSEVAAIKYDDTLVPIPCRELKDVFAAVRSGDLDYGLVPVENTVQGGVTEASDLFIYTDLSVIGEVKNRIQHFMLAAENSSPEDIRVAYSHPQALAQCRGFLEKYGIEGVPFFDTAGAAEMIRKKQIPGAAAIAGGKCASLYGLNIVAENIQDEDTNTTRFFVISREKEQLDKGNKCSIAFITDNRTGALSSILKLFATEGIDLTRVESRPVKSNPGEYAFLLDFKGSILDTNVQKVLSEVEKGLPYYNFLGCYKEGTL